MVVGRAKWLKRVSKRPERAPDYAVIVSEMEVGQKGVHKLHLNLDKFE